jgi:nitroimidazol reductase NimA-like FMN-containing flavoprotein (pyridoxamine 5'-phosphate oxidase superfamily)
MTTSLAMTQAEREAFLADRHVAVLSVEAGGRAPLAVPVWYSYEPGKLLSLVTGNESRKARLPRASGRASLCVQTEELPYRYVSVDGPVVEIEHPAQQAERRALAHRYLDTELGDAYLASTRDVASTMTTFRISPEPWLTEDRSKRFA